MSKPSFAIEIGDAISAHITADYGDPWDYSGRAHAARAVLATPAMQAIREHLLRQCPDGPGCYDPFERRIVTRRETLERLNLPESVIDWVLDGEAT